MKLPQETRFCENWGHFHTANDLQNQNTETSFRSDFFLQITESTEDQFASRLADFMKLVKKKLYLLLSPFISGVDKAPEFCNKNYQLCSMMM